MNGLRLLGGTAALAAGMYLLGRQSSAPAPADPVPAVGPAAPADIKVANPTAVLLGEASVPHEALRGPITPATGLIVPEITK